MNRESVSFSTRYPSFGLVEEIPLSAGTPQKECCKCEWLCKDPELTVVSLWMQEDGEALRWGMMWGKVAEWNFSVGQIYNHGMRQFRGRERLFAQKYPFYQLERMTGMTSLFILLL